VTQSADALLREEHVWHLLIGEAGPQGRPGTAPWGPPARAALHRLVTTVGNQGRGPLWVWQRRGPVTEAARSPGPPGVTVQPTRQGRLLVLSPPAPETT
jgi:hypothetical protein